MTKELGVGIIGCGNISMTYFALSPLFKGIKVLACADLNPEAARQRALNYPVGAEYSYTNTGYNLLRDGAAALDCVEAVVRSLEEHLPVDFTMMCNHEAQDGILTVNRVGARSAPLALEMIQGVSG